MLAGLSANSMDAAERSTEESMDELAALIHHAADESKAYFAALNGAK